MDRRRRILRRMWVGYLVVLLGTLPLALRCWRLWCQDTIGRWVSAEAAHLVEYAVLGWLAARYGGVCERRRRALTGPLLISAGVGVADELVQAGLPERVFQWSDVWLNWAGVLLGGMVWAGWRRVVDARPRSTTVEVTRDDV